MSRFYASIKGSRGEATRQGGEKSGILGHIRGWDFGVEVVGYVNSKGQDEFSINLTGGSNGSMRPVHLGDYKREDYHK